MKVIRVEITTADGIIRLWVAEDAAAWGTYMARQHGTERVPKPTAVINPENAASYRKAKDALRRRKGTKGEGK